MYPRQREKEVFHGVINMVTVFSHFEELALNFLKELYIKAVLKMVFERVGLCVADGNVKATVGWIILASSH